MNSALRLSSSGRTKGSFSTVEPNPNTLQDLRVPPGNRLEALKGNREGLYSIRINQQWRLCFRWEDNDAFDVEIVDYH